MKPFKTNEILLDDKKAKVKKLKEELANAKDKIVLLEIKVGEQTRYKQIFIEKKDIYNKALELACKEIETKRSTRRTFTGIEVPNNYWKSKEDIRKEFLEKARKK